MLVAVATFSSVLIFPGFNNVVLPAFCALISGSVYMLMVAKVQKFGAISLYLEKPFASASNTSFAFVIFEISEFRYIAKEAYDRGARHATHLYNAMPPFSHRAPGVVGAACDSDHVRVELICDGVHLHPSTVRTTFKMFGDDRICLISDSMMATGLSDGDYSLGGQPVKVVGNLATLADGTIAGSATNLMDCMRTAVKKMGIPLGSAVKCAAVNTAKAIGIYDTYGSITPGKKANIVLLDQDLNMKYLIFKGELQK